MYSGTLKRILLTYKIIKVSFVFPHLPPDKRARKCIEMCPPAPKWAIDVRRRVGMVFQRPAPFPTMSIYVNVLSGFALNGIKLSKAEKFSPGTFYPHQAPSVWMECNKMLCFLTFCSNKFNTQNYNKPYNCKNNRLPE